MRYSFTFESSPTGPPDAGPCRIHGPACRIPWGWDHDHTDSPRPYTLDELEARQDPPHFFAYPTYEEYERGFYLWRAIFRDGRLNAEEEAVRFEVLRAEDGAVRGLLGWVLRRRATGRTGRPKFATGGILPIAPLDGDQLPAILSPCRYMWPDPEPLWQIEHHEIEVPDDATGGEFRTLASSGSSTFTCACGWTTGSVPTEWIAGMGREHVAEHHPELFAEFERLIG